jgi:predicted nucleic acid-binding protein
VTVILDTNVFASSFCGGKPRTVVDGWKRGSYSIGLSEPFLDEYFTALRRMDLDERKLGELLDLFREQYNLLYAADTPDLKIVEENPDDDNKFIEAAVALEAESIVTGDQVLRDVDTYMNIPIQTPDEFLSNRSV